MSLDTKRNLFKSAPILIFRSGLNFISEYNLEQCLTYLETSPINDDTDYFLKYEISEILVEHSRVFFLAKISGYRFNVYFLGKIEEEKEGTSSRISGYSGAPLLWLVVLILTLAIFALFTIPNHTTLPETLNILAIIFVVSISFCYCNTFFLRGALEGKILRIFHYKEKAIDSTRQE
jgi:hypothetical protein